MTRLAGTDVWYLTVRDAERLPLRLRAVAERPADQRSPRARRSAARPCKAIR